MKVFAVGGAVRDELLGLPVQDRDWVVVGATPEEMAARGYKPVGKDFPVFLHPETREEYALARTERKTAPGYKGFVFHTDAAVSIEDDLARRDLTINAVAKAEDGSYIDPHNGRADLAAKVLRHVSPAFVEDPVRVLRVARFAARLADFTIAGETMALMRAMVDNGEVDHLVPERVWQELARGLMEAQPSRMFETLRACGALRKILPELDRLWGVPQRADYHPEVDTGTHVMMVVDMAAGLKLPLTARFAALTHDLGKGTTPADVLPRHIGHEQRSANLLGPLCERLRVPAECRELAVLVARFHGDIYKIDELRPKTVVTILERCDVFRRPERFEELLGACEADYRGRLGFESREFPQSQSWRDATEAARAVDAGAVARACSDPAQIPQRVHEARVSAVTQVIGN
ncbi:MAG: multifunctional CCA addition/repair protein [Rhodocyclales bacterium]|nr:multifunctional CCA addition/repair protein [Rhodocyclales bacterium]